MDIYFLLLFWSWISAVVFYKDGRFYFQDVAMKKIYLGLNFIPLGLVMAARDVHVGSDTLMYINVYKETCEAEFDWSFVGYPNSLEIGFRALNKCLSFISVDENFFILAISVLLMWGIATFFFRMSANVCASTYLFIGLGFYTEMYNTMRQQLALVIICICIQYLINGQRAKWLLGIICAMSFHLISAIFIVLYPLIKITKTKFRLMIVLPWLGVILIYFLTPMLIDMFVETKYIIYFAMEKENGPWGDIMRIILFFGALAICYWNRRKIERYYTKEEIICLGMLVYYGAMLAFAALFAPGLYRLTQYFTIFICVFLPNVLRLLSVSKILVYCMIFIFVPIVLHRLLTVNISTLQYMLFF